MSYIVLLMVESSRAQKKRYIAVLADHVRTVCVRLSLISTIRTSVYRVLFIYLFWRACFLALEYVRTVSLWRLDLVLHCFFVVSLLVSFFYSRVPGMWGGTDFELCYANSTVGTLQRMQRELRRKCVCVDSRLHELTRMVTFSHHQQLCMYWGTVHMSA